MDWPNGSTSIPGLPPCFWSIRNFEALAPFTAWIITSGRWRDDTLKATDGLETVDEHIRVLSDMHMVEGEVFLLQALVHAGEASQLYQEEVAAWKNGDTKRLYAMYVGRMKEAPTVWWRLLDRRNAKWVPRIESAIKSGRPTLVVAGALHFSGPRSVIALLQKRGYKIEQL